MASKTKRTTTIRKRKRHTKGKQRKAALRRNGSTPKPSVLFGDQSLPSLKTGL